MQITILGSGTSIPHPDRASPGLVVRTGRSSILVDPGSGSLHRAARYGIPLREIDYICFSHFHPDHTGDLVPLLFALKNDFYFEAKKLTLVGPPGLRELHARLEEFYQDWVRLPRERLTFYEMHDDLLKKRDWTVRSLPVPHTENSIGFRFTDLRDRVFTYSGDSDYCAALIDLARDADAALIESAQPSDLKVSGHLTPRLAGELALRAKARQLILTHRYPVCDDYDLLAEVRTSGYQGPVALAYDGMQIMLE